MQPGLTTTELCLIEYVSGSQTVACINHKNHPEFLILQVWWDLRICTSNKSSGDSGGGCWADTLKTAALWTD